MSEKEVQDFTVRMPKSLHHKATELAAQKGISLAKLINMVLADYMNGIATGSTIEEFRHRIEKLEKEVFKK